ncbi:unnamed protein product [Leptidea sinapis]|uniref:Uncharacterized protein n=1 Tax=Leptidea sinapis TaxID=189913 RepID=A0A5E4QAW8_9NEOP|nr:unnamed protein product [Leptidea sinapis]
MPGYFFACVFQAYGTLMACAWITSYDCIALSVMIFFKLELELINNASLYDSCASPLLMLYMFIVTVMLCSTAYQMDNKMYIFRHNSTTYAHAKNTVSMIS